MHRAGAWDRVEACIRGKGRVRKEDNHCPPSAEQSLLASPALTAVPQRQFNLGLEKRQRRELDLEGVTQPKFQLGCNTCPMPIGS